MNNNELLNKLLGIAKLHVVKSDFIGEEKLHLGSISAVPVASCPDCGQVSNLVHDESEAQMIRTSPLRKNKSPWCIMHVVSNVKHSKRRLSSVSNGSVPMSVYQAVRALYLPTRPPESVSQVAQDESLSEEAVQAMFEYRAKKRRKNAATHK